MSTEAVQNTNGKKKLLSQQAKLIIILGAEFIAITAILMLILFAGKKSHTVTFDLNGGILISGDLEQRVTQGQSATPPTVAKYGHYLLRWSGSYKSVTRDVTVKAIWEYETSPGIEYSVPENTNYCQVSGSLREIQGDVYIGSFYNDRQVMGIEAGAFKDRTGITGVYLLDGILAIESEAFAGCENLEVIDIPSTVVRIGRDAFKGCTSLKEIILPESLKTLEASVFEGCGALEEVTFNEGIKSIDVGCFAGCASLKEVILPKSLEKIERGTFTTPEMTIKLCILEEEVPVGFIDGWHRGDATLIFGYDPVEEEESDEKDGDGKDKGGKENDGSGIGIWG